MHAVVFTLVSTVLIAGGIFLLVGARLRLSIDAQQNDLLNFLAYALGALPVAFVIVLFGIG